MHPALEILRLTPAQVPALESFFSALVKAGDERFFHPHPLTPEYAKIVTSQKGKDLYYGAISGDTVLAYGMLRGWDEGFAVPSLGIAIHPLYRGFSLGKNVMHFLHLAAILRGATRVRLTVDPSNAGAIGLYRSLGYIFITERIDRLVGTLELNPIPSIESYLGFTSKK